MNHKLVLTIVLVLVASVQALADDAAQTPVVDASDKAAVQQNMGKSVIIKGKIENAEWSRRGKVMNIDFAGAKESGLLAVIFEKNRKAMDEAFGGDVGKALTGAGVRIEGVLKEYGGKAESMKGRPQIIIERITQITIVEPPATQPAN